MRNGTLQVLGMLACTALGMSGELALAGPVGAMTTFTAGTTARASEVNGNFGAVKTAVDDNDGRITTNAASITTNAANITTNATGITNNASGIAANAAVIAGKQDRVTGTCAVGSSVRAVNADGTVVCETGLATTTALNTGLATKVNKAGDTMTGTLTAPGFAYSSPVAGQVIALPNTCIAGNGSNIAMHQDMLSNTQPNNSLGPSISSAASGPNQTRSFFCPIPLHVPPGAAVTITGATLKYTDNGVNCRVQAEIRHRLFSTSNDFGTVVSTVFNGADATDFAFTGPGGFVTGTKAFPAFTLAVPSNRIVWVNATIAFNATGGGDCRYSGVLVDYTVDRP